MRIDRMEPRDVYYAETAIAELELAEKMWQQKRLARAQEHLREARYWAFKVPEEEFTGTPFLNNLRELELKLLRGF